MLGMLPSVLVDDRIGGLDRFLEPECEALLGHFEVVRPLGDHVGVDRVGRLFAGDLTRGGATHAIGDDEQGAARADVVLADLGLERGDAPREIRDEEAVLVVIARLADVGAPEDLDLERRHGVAPTDWSMVRRRVAC